MQNKKVKILFIMFLMFILTFAHTANIDALQKHTYTPYSLKGVQALKDYKDLFNDLKRIRENMNTINISESTVELKAGELIRQINFYSNQIKSIRNNLENHKVIYQKSQVDVILASKIDIIAYLYEISLQLQENLISEVGKGNSNLDTIFLSESLSNIYYYLSLGDSHMSYLDSKYNLSSTK